MDPLPLIMHNTVFPPVFQPAVARPLNVNYLESSADTIFRVNEPSKVSSPGFHHVMDLAHCIPDLSPNDVVLSAGKVTAPTVGNRRFKEIIRRLSDKYRAATSQLEREHMANAVIRTVRMSNPPGRFLINTEELDEPSTDAGNWTDAGNKYAQLRVAEHLKAESILWHGLRRPTARSNSVPIKMSRSSWASGA